jgi:AraC family transcriptional regulator
MSPIKHLYWSVGRCILAKIAVELDKALSLRAAAGAPGEAHSRILAQGDGWTVADVICTSGRHDRPYEERHHNYSIALVTAGSFQYRGDLGCELMTPGSLMLGNAGQPFECGHEHGEGDRCLAFWYTPDYFEQLAADAGARKAEFPVLRLPSLRELSPLSARAMAAFQTSSDGWEELSVELAAHVLKSAGRPSPAAIPAPPSTLSRVTRTVRMIERYPEGSLTLSALAHHAGLSLYHFLRVFERLTGLTPHQYILRTRLREAAARLATESAKVLDVALDCGFGDVSNFNRSFRAEFGASPRAFRTRSSQSTLSSSGER